jgi:hypothetical protein
VITHLSSQPLGSSSPRPEVSRSKKHRRQPDEPPTGIPPPTPFPRSVYLPPRWSSTPRAASPSGSFLGPAAARLLLSSAATGPSCCAAATGAAALSSATLWSTFGARSLGAVLWPCWKGRVAVVFAATVAVAKGGAPARISAASALPSFRRPASVKTAEAMAGTVAAIRAELSAPASRPGTHSSHAIPIAAAAAAAASLVSHLRPVPLRVPASPRSGGVRATQASPSERQVWEQDRPDRPSSQRGPCPLGGVTSVVDGRLTFVVSQFPFPGLFANVMGVKALTCQYGNITD